ETARAVADDLAAGHLELRPRTVRDDTALLAVRELAVADGHLRLADGVALRVDADPALARRGAGDAHVHDVDVAQYRAGVPEMDACEQPRAARHVARGEVEVEVGEKDARHVDGDAGDVEPAADRGGERRRQRGRADHGASAILPEEANRLIDDELLGV